MSISLEITNKNGKFMLRINQLYWIGSFLQLLGMQSYTLAPNAKIIKGR